jgi:hypothetical protein
VIGTDGRGPLPHRDAVDQAITVNGVPLPRWDLRAQGSGTFGSNDNFVAVPITTFDEQFPGGKPGHGTPSTSRPCRRAEDAWRSSRRRRRSWRARRGLRPDQPNDFALFTSQAQLEQFQQTTAVAAAMLIIAAQRPGGRRA